MKVPKSIKYAYLTPLENHIYNGSHQQTKPQKEKRENNNTQPTSILLTH